MAILFGKDGDYISLTDMLQAKDGEFFIRACDVGVCSDRQIPQVLQEWREPRHDAFEPRNVWSFFNAFTEALNGNLIELPRWTEALHGMLDLHVGLNSRS